MVFLSFLKIESQNQISTTGAISPAAMVSVPKSIAPTVPKAASPKIASGPTGVKTATPEYRVSKAFRSRRNANKK